MRFDGFSRLLDHWAEHTPDAPALRWGEVTLRFSGLRDAARRRAEALRASGRTCLGILADGSLDCVIEIFAGNLAGLQLVLLDANQPESVLSSLLRYVDADALWCADGELAEALAPALTGAPGVSGAGNILFFTSGTTARAKAVVLTDRSLCQSAWNGSQMLRSFLPSVLQHSGVEADIGK